MKCTVYPFDRLGEYKYSVIAAQHLGKWVFSKHKERDTWELAGGHIEPGETPYEAACRELYEETGATRFDIVPLCDYWACDEPHEVEAIEWSNGQVYFATVHKMGPLPKNSEMQAVGLFDAFPTPLTYPDIAIPLGLALRRFLSEKAQGTKEPGLLLKRLDGMFAVCKMSSPEGVDLSSPHVFVAKTEDELSLVCDANRVPPGAVAVEAPWRALKIDGELDFSMVGVIAGISSALAARGVSLFVASTFNTDYILLKAESFERAVTILRESGYAIE